MLLTRNFVTRTRKITNTAGHLGTGVLGWRSEWSGVSMADTHVEGCSFNGTQNLQDNIVSLEAQNKHYLFNGC